MTDLFPCDCGDTCTGLAEWRHVQPPEHVTVDGVELRDRTAGELGLCGNGEEP